MTGSLTIAGLGPGDEALITPEVSTALAAATDIVGYAPYVARVRPREGLTLHPSDNRVELQRAGEALRLAAEGRDVVVVSSGDPGVFAMASAVFEALEDAPQWRDLPVRVLPGVTAMLAAAAEVGAPLGGDFCAISLSDNLKAWTTIERRLSAAAEADFVIALYNPASKARPRQLGEALALLRSKKKAETPVLFIRAAGTSEAKVVSTTLGAAHAATADMRTLVIIGASTTRQVGRWIYTPRGERSVS